MKKETTQPESQSDDQLMQKFTQSKSSAEIKKTAAEIVKSEPDIDKENLEEAHEQFQQEKREDAAKQAKNDAQFEQPKT